MQAVLKKRGDLSHLNKHNLLTNLEARDQHPITTIVDLEKNLIDINKMLKDVSEKIEYGDIGGNLGFISRPRFLKRNFYDPAGNLVKEVYEGDLSKIVDYSYSEDNVLLSKVVKRNDGREFSCTYQYDDMGRLEYEDDNGTREEYVHTSGGLAMYHTIHEVLSASSKTLICDVNKEFENLRMGTIVAMELVVKNTHSTTSSFFIERNGEEIIASTIESFNTQKYNLGISKNISIYVRGNVEVEVNISYIKNDDINSGLNPDMYTLVKNIGDALSEVTLVYDDLLRTTRNTQDSFTDILEDGDNFLKVVKGGVRV